MPPSKALSKWQGTQSLALAEMEAQCIASLTVVSPGGLSNENLRCYTMSLSAHFQEFCRELYFECVIGVLSGLPPDLEYVLQFQCSARIELEGANPRFESIKTDFQRFGIELSAELGTSTDPSVARMIGDINQLNAARNYAAHRKANFPPSGPITLSAIEQWRAACDGIAVRLDDVMYNYLATKLGRAPW